MKHGKRLTESWQRVAVSRRISVQCHFYKKKMDVEAGMEDNGAVAEVSGCPLLTHYGAITDKSHFFLHLQLGSLSPPNAIGINQVIICPGGKGRCTGDRGRAAEQGSKRGLRHSLASY